MTSWITGHSVDREGLAAYTHLIRSPDDPHETTNRGAGWGANNTTAWKEVTKGEPAAWVIRVLEVLADGQAKTFNRICIELCGRTADVCFEQNPDHALWALVEAKRVEHTLEAPILFRLVSKDEAAARGRAF